MTARSLGVRLVPATVRHCMQVARNMRPSDVQEVQACHGPDVCIARNLLQSGAMSMECWAAVDDSGRAVAILGLAPVSLLGDVACPWMLGTPEVSRHAKALMVLGRQYVQRWAAKYPRLVNYVDVRNTTSVRWLKRLGFVMDKPYPFGVLGLPFMRFEWAGGCT